MFRQHHVGLSKAQVARDAVLAFLPKTAPRPSITAHHANVKQPEFGVAFFQKFDIVLNGLDNLEARRCDRPESADPRTPLIEP